VNTDKHSLADLFQIRPSYPDKGIVSPGSSAKMDFAEIEVQ
jgi:hypothetical protein